HERFGNTGSPDPTPLAGATLGAHQADSGTQGRMRRAPGGVAYRSGDRIVPCSLRRRTWSSVAGPSYGDRAGELGRGQTQTRPVNGNDWFGRPRRTPSLADPECPVNDNPSGAVLPCQIVSPSRQGAQSDDDREGGKRPANHVERRCSTTDASPQITVDQLA